MRSLVRRLWYVMRRGRLDADLAEEIEFHRAMKERDLRRDGFDPEEAAFAASRALGNTLVARERARDVWIAPWFQGVLQDLRFAVRLLLKDRAFTTTAVLTLALGIGANTTIFSAVYAVLLKPLPFRDADRLIGIWKKNPPRGWTHNPISEAEFLAWQNQGRVFEDLAAFTGASCVVTGGIGAEEDPCEKVSSNLFPMLGVAPVLGRVFVREEDQATAAPVVLLSEGLWRRRFGGDSRVIGRAMTINGVSRTVVGVMPAGLAHGYSTSYAPMPQLWLSGIALSAERTWNDFVAVGRLKQGVSLVQAEAALAPVSAGLEHTYPDLKGWRAELRTLRDMSSGDIQPALLVLLGAVAFVLLIACANVANLLLARGAARTHEFMLRAALGAGEWRVVRQLLTESLLLSLTGGALGVFLAWWGTKSLVSLAPAYVVNSAPGLERAPLNLAVLAFVLVVGLVTTLLFGLAPAFQGARPDLAGALKETSRGSMHPRRARFRSVLVIAQIALAMVLLVGAGLMIRTLAKLRAVDLGFERSHVLTMRVTLTGHRYPEPRAIAAFWTELVQSIEALPGVESASVSRGVPIGDWAGQFFTTADHPNPTAGHVADANYIVVGRDYFKTLRIPLRGGRTFDDHDTQSAGRVAVVNEQLARTQWPGENPVGKRLRMGSAASPLPWLSVVGVVGNVLSQGATLGAHPEIYVPYEQFPWVLTPQTLIVRTTAGVTPSNLTSAVLRELQRIDKDQPAADIRTLDQLAGEPMAEQRMVAALLGGFGGLALVLSALGVYGVLSYSVVQRAREIGVRVALGAKPSSVLRLVIGDGARLAAIGIGLGITAALALTRVLTELLYGVRPNDALTLVAGIVLLAGASLVACYVPGRRALGVDPIEVLRQE